MELYTCQWGSTTSTTLGPSFSISMSDGHEYSSEQLVGTLIFKILRLQVTGMHYIPRFLNLDATTASSAQSFFNSMWTARFRYSVVFLKSPSWWCNTLKVWYERATSSWLGPSFFNRICSCSNLKVNKVYLILGKEDKRRRLLYLDNFSTAVDWSKNGKQYIRANRKNNSCPQRRTP